MSEAAVIAALDGWRGAAISVRITTGANELVAVFSGRLGKRSEAKAPALFWPVEQSEMPSAEEPGLYLHPGSFEAGLIHEGAFVLEFQQGGVTTNVRRLNAP